VKIYLLLAAAFCTGVAAALAAVMYMLDGAGTGDPAASIGNFYVAAMFWLVPLALVAWAVRFVVGSVLDVIDWRRGGEHRRPRAVVA
jgi:hypothetical protein